MSEGNITMKATLSALILSLTPIHGANALDIRGISVGDAWNVATFQEALRGGSGISESSQHPFCTESLCIGLIQFGPALARVHVYGNYGKVFNISLEFEPKDFDDVILVLTKKYGAPQSVQPSVKSNAYGSKVDSTTVVWMDGEVELSAERYSTLSSSGIVLRKPPAKSVGEL